MKLKDLRRYAKKSLGESGISDADSSKLELLFEYAFNFSRNFILSEPDFEIPEDEKLERFNEALASVCKGAPIQYVVGFSYFCGLKFTVTPDVLIPRFETELLADMGVRLVEKISAGRKKPVNVLDLCSGSGAIGIAVKKRCPSCSVTLSDVSAAAIEVSKINAERILGSRDALEYRIGNFLDPFLKDSEKFDLVLSNPPYIPSEVIRTLPGDVRDYEPRLALDGGAGGLVPYEKIAANLCSVCSPSGIVVFEIGEEQAKAVKSILRSKGFGLSETVKDLDGKDRFAAALRTGAPISESSPDFEDYRSSANALRSVISPSQAPEGIGYIDKGSSGHAAKSEAPVARSSAPAAKYEAPAARSAGHASESATPANDPLPPLSDSGASGAGLLSPVSVIKGVGPKTAAALGKLGIGTLSDLISYYPAGYEDRTAVATVAGISKELLPGESRSATLFLRVESLTERGNPSMPVYIFTCSDQTGTVDAVFFNNSYVKNVLRPGRTFCFYGKVKKNRDFFGGLSILQPKFADASSASKMREFMVLSPVYRTSGRLGNKDMANAVKGAFDILGDELTRFESSKPDLPRELSAKYGLPPAPGLIRTLHFPKTAEAALLAKRRMDFEDLLNISLNIRALKAARESGIKGFSFPPCDLSRFKSKLPFTLTVGQQTVIDEVFKDMESSMPMNRLINGDVGSGKTVVALAAIYNAVSAGFQAALMVPSTVLAAQHMAKISGILGMLGIDSEMLYSSTGARDRKRILKRIENGEPICLIGTHSLIGDNVNFKNLGLVVIDEQHRFGVLQRAHLIAKSGDTLPDVLSLTATPIPRSLALILYGDMDISVLSEKPGGRMPVSTYLYSGKDRPAIYKRCRELVKSGGRAYIVHAKIDNNDDIATADEDELTGCVENRRELSKTVFAGIPTGIIHGKLSDREKQSAMEAFASGETRILFSTTVIEVGVDVPEATLMIIEDAERFGLSTLHQLRGRVGRGSEKSYCILISNKSSERLQIMTETNDGFRIAEKDLELRGPGDFFGTAQTGISEDAMLASAADPKLLEAVKYSADFIFDKAAVKDPECEAYLDSVTEKAKRITL